MDADVNELAHVPPSVAIAGLCIWVHGRAFEERDDYWNGNYLHVTARYQTASSTVRVRGPIFTSLELKRWRDDLVGLHERLTGFARIECSDPELQIRIDAKRHGHLEMEVIMAPAWREEHRFSYIELDQTYLPPLIREIDAVLSEYPIRGTPKRV